jgi:hypothetical protein
MANRLLLGKFAANDYRLRISKPTFNVMSALTPDQLIFDSTTYVQTSRVFTSGVKEYDAGPEGTVLSNFITWPDLGYRPFMIFWYKPATQGRKGLVTIAFTFKIKTNGVDIIYGTNVQTDPDDAPWAGDMYWVGFKVPEGGILG